MAHQPSTQTLAAGFAALRGPTDTRSRSADPAPRRALPHTASPATARAPSPAHDGLTHHALDALRRVTAKPATFADLHAVPPPGSPRTPPRCSPRSMGEPLAALVADLTSPREQRQAAPLQPDLAGASLTEAISTGPRTGEPRQSAHVALTADSLAKLAELTSRQEQRRGSQPNDGEPSSPERRRSRDRVLAGFAQLKARAQARGITTPPLQSPPRTPPRTPPRSPPAKTPQGSSGPGSTAALLQDLVSRPSPSRALPQSAIVSHTALPVVDMSPALVRTLRRASAGSSPAASPPPAPKSEGRGPEAGPKEGEGPPQVARRLSVEQREAQRARDVIDLHARFLELRKSEEGAAPAGDAVAAARAVLQKEKEEASTQASTLTSPTSQAPLPAPEASPSHRKPAPLTSMGPVPVVESPAPRPRAATLLGPPAVISAAALRAVWPDTVDELPGLRFSSLGCVVLRAAELLAAGPDAHTELDVLRVVLTFLAALAEPLLADNPDASAVYTGFDTPSDAPRPPIPAQDGSSREPTAAPAPPPQPPQAFLRHSLAAQLGFEAVVAANLSARACDGDGLALNRYTATSACATAVPPWLAPPARPCSAAQPTGRSRVSLSPVVSSGRDLGGSTPSRSFLSLLAPVRDSVNAPLPSGFGPRWAAWLAGGGDGATTDAAAAGLPRQILEQAVASTAAHGHVAAVAAGLLCYVDHGHAVVVATDGIARLDSAVLSLDGLSGVVSVPGLPPCRLLALPALPPAPTGACTVRAPAVYEEAVVALLLWAALPERFDDSPPHAAPPAALATIAAWAIAAAPGAQTTGYGELLRSALLRDLVVGPLFTAVGGPLLSATLAARRPVDSGATSGIGTPHASVVTPVPTPGVAREHSVGSAAFDHVMGPLQAVLRGSVFGRHKRKQADLAAAATMQLLRHVFVAQDDVSLLLQRPPGRPAGAAAPRDPPLFGSASQSLLGAASMQREGSSRDAAPASTHGASLVAGARGALDSFAGGPVVAADVAFLDGATAAAEAPSPARCRARLVLLAPPFLAALHHAVVLEGRPDAATAARGVSRVLNAISAVLRTVWASPGIAAHAAAVAAALESLSAPSSDDDGGASDSAASAASCGDVATESLRGVAASNCWFGGRPVPCAVLSATGLTAAFTDRIAAATATVPRGHPSPDNGRASFGAEAPPATSFAAPALAIGAAGLHALLALPIDAALPTAAPPQAPPQSDGTPAVYTPGDPSRVLASSQGIFAAVDAATRDTALSAWVAAREDMSALAASLAAEVCTACPALFAAVFPVADYAAWQLRFVRRARRVGLGAGPGSSQSLQEGASTSGRRGSSTVSGHHSIRGLLTLAVFGPAQSADKLAASGQHSAALSTAVAPFDDAWCFEPTAGLVALIDAAMTAVSDVALHAMTDTVLDAGRGPSLDPAPFVSSPMAPCDTATFREASEDSSPLHCASAPHVALAGAAVRRAYALAAVCPAAHRLLTESPGVRGALVHTVAAVVARAVVRAEQAPRGEPTAGRGPTAPPSGGFAFGAAAPRTEHLPSWRDGDVAAAIRSTVGPVLDAVAALLEQEPVVAGVAQAARARAPSVVTGTAEVAAADAAAELVGHAATLEVILSPCYGPRVVAGLSGSPQRAAVSELLRGRLDEAELFGAPCPPAPAMPQGIAPIGHDADSAEVGSAPVSVCLPDFLCPADVAALRAARLFIGRGVEAAADPAPSTTAAAVHSQARATVRGLVHQQWRGRALFDVALNATAQRPLLPGPGAGQGRDGALGNTAAHLGDVASEAQARLGVELRRLLFYPSGEQLAEADATELARVAGCLVRALPCAPTALGQVGPTPDPPSVAPTATTAVDPVAHLAGTRSSVSASPAPVPAEASLRSAHSFVAPLPQGLEAPGTHAPTTPNALAQLRAVAAGPRAGALCGVLFADGGHHQLLLFLAATGGAYSDAVAARASGFGGASKAAASGTVDDAASRARWAAMRGWLQYTPVLTALLVSLFPSAAPSAVGPAGGLRSLHRPHCYRPGSCRETAREAPLAEPLGHSSSSSGHSGATIPVRASSSPATPLPAPLHSSYPGLLLALATLETTPWSALRASAPTRDDPLSQRGPEGTAGTAGSVPERGLHGGGGSLEWGWAGSPALIVAVCRAVGTAALACPRSFAGVLSVVSLQARQEAAGSLSRALHAAVDRVTEQSATLGAAFSGSGEAMLFHVPQLWSGPAAALLRSDQALAGVVSVSLASDVLGDGSATASVQTPGSPPKADTPHALLPSVFSSASRRLSAPDGPPAAAAPEVQRLRSAVRSAVADGVVPALQHMAAVLADPLAFPLDAQLRGDVQATVRLVIGVSSTLGTGKGPSAMASSRRDSAMVSFDGPPATTAMPPLLLSTVRRCADTWLATTGCAAYIACHHLSSTVAAHLIVALLNIVRAPLASWPARIDAMATECAHYGLAAPQDTDELVEAVVATLQATPATTQLASALRLLERIGHALRSAVVRPLSADRDIGVAAQFVRSVVPLLSGAGPASTAAGAEFLALAAAVAPGACAVSTLTGARRGLLSGAMALYLNLEAAVSLQHARPVRAADTTASFHIGRETGSVLAAAGSVSSNTAQASQASQVSQGASGAGSLLGVGSHRGGRSPSLHSRQSKRSSTADAGVPLRWLPRWLLVFARAAAEHGLLPSQLPALHAAFVALATRRLRGGLGPGADVATAFVRTTAHATRSIVALCRRAQDGTGAGSVATTLLCVSSHGLQQQLALARPWLDDAAATAILDVIGQAAGPGSRRDAAAMALAEHGFLPCHYGLLLRAAVLSLRTPPGTDESSASGSRDGAPCSRRPTGPSGPTTTDRPFAWASAADVLEPVRTTREDRATLLLATTLDDVARAVLPCDRGAPAAPMSAVNQALRAVLASRTVRLVALRLLPHLRAGPVGATHGGAAALTAVAPAAASDAVPADRRDERRAVPPLEAALDPSVWHLPDVGAAVAFDATALSVTVRLQRLGFDAPSCAALLQAVVVAAARLPDALDAVDTVPVQPPDEGRRASFTQAGGRRRSSAAPSAPPRPAAPVAGAANRADGAATARVASAWILRLCSAVASRFQQPVLTAEAQGAVYAGVSPTRGSLSGPFPAAPAAVAPSPIPLGPARRHVAVVQASLAGLDNKVAAVAAAVAALHCGPAGPDRSRGPPAEEAYAVQHRVLVAVSGAGAAPSTEAPGKQPPSARQLPDLCGDLAGDVAHALERLHAVSHAVPLLLSVEDPVATDPALDRLLWRLFLAGVGAARAFEFVAALGQAATGAPVVERGLAVCLSAAGGAGGSESHTPGSTGLGSSLGRDSAETLMGGPEPGDAAASWVLVAGFLHGALQRRVAFHLQRGLATASDLPTAPLVNSSSSDTTSPTAPFAPDRRQTGPADLSASTPLAAMASGMAPAQSPGREATSVAEQAVFDLLAALGSAEAASADGPPPSPARSGGGTGLTATLPLLPAAVTAAVHLANRVVHHTSVGPGVSYHAIQRLCHAWLTHAHAAQFSSPGTDVAELSPLAGPGASASTAAYSSTPSSGKGGASMHSLLPNLTHTNSGTAIVAGISSVLGSHDAAGRAAGIHWALYGQPLNTASLSDHSASPAVGAPAAPPAIEAALHAMGLHAAGPRVPALPPATGALLAVFAARVSAGMAASTAAAPFAADVVAAVLWVPDVPVLAQRLGLEDLYEHSADVALEPRPAAAGESETAVDLGPDAWRCELLGHAALLAALQRERDDSMAGYDQSLSYVADNEMAETDRRFSFRWLLGACMRSRGAQLIFWVAAELAPLAAPGTAPASLAGRVQQLAVRALASGVTREELLAAVSDVESVVVDLADIAFDPGSFAEAAAAPVVAEASPERGLPRGPSISYRGMASISFTAGGDPKANRDALRSPAQRAAAAGAQRWFDTVRDTLHVVHARSDTRTIPRCVVTRITKALDTYERRLRTAPAGDAHRTTALARDFEHFSARWADARRTRSAPTYGDFVAVDAHSGVADSASSLARSFAGPGGDARLRTVLRAFGTVACVSLCQLSLRAGSGSAVRKGQFARAKAQLVDVLLTHLLPVTCVAPLFENAWGCVAEFALGHIEASLDLQDAALRLDLAAVVARLWQGEVLPAMGQAARTMLSLQGLVTAGPLPRAEGITTPAQLFEAVAAHTAHPRPEHAPLVDAVRASISNAAAVAADTARKAEPGGEGEFEGVGLDSGVRGPGSLQAEMEQLADGDVDLTRLVHYAYQDLQPFIVRVADLTDALVALQRSGLCWDGTTGVPLSVLGHLHEQAEAEAALESARQQAAARRAKMAPTDPLSAPEASVAVTPAEESAPTGPAAKVLGAIPDDVVACVLDALGGSCRELPSLALQKPTVSRRHSASGSGAAPVEPPLRSQMAVLTVPSATWRVALAVVRLVSLRMHHRWVDLTKCLQQQRTVAGEYSRMAGQSGSLGTTLSALSMRHTRGLDGSTATGSSDLDSVPGAAAFYWTADCVAGDDVFQLYRNEGFIASVAAQMPNPVVATALFAKIAGTARECVRGILDRGAGVFVAQDTVEGPVAILGAVVPHEMRPLANHMGFACVTEADIWAIAQGVTRVCDSLVAQADAGDLTTPTPGADRVALSNYFAQCKELWLYCSRLLLADVVALRRGPVRAPSPPSSPSDTTASTTVVMSPHPAQHAALHATALRWLRATPESALRATLHLSTSRLPELVDAAFASALLAELVAAVEAAAPVALSSPTAVTDTNSSEAMMPPLHRLGLFCLFIGKTPFAALPLLGDALATVFGFTAALPAASVDFSPEGQAAPGPTVDGSAEAPAPSAGDVAVFVVQAADAALTRGRRLLSTVGAHRQGLVAALQPPSLDGVRELNAALRDVSRRYGLAVPHDVVVGFFEIAAEVVTDPALAAEVGAHPESTVRHAQWLGALLSAAQIRFLRDAADTGRLPHLCFALLVVLGGQGPRSASTPSKRSSVASSSGSRHADPAEVEAARRVLAPLLLLLCDDATLVARLQGGDFVAAMLTTVNWRAMAARYVADKAGVVAGCTEHLRGHPQLINAAGGSDGSSPAVVAKARRAVKTAAQCFEQLFVRVRGDPVAGEVSANVGGALDFFLGVRDLYLRAVLEFLGSVRLGQEPLLPQAAAGLLGDAAQPTLAPNAADSSSSFFDDEDTQLGEGLVVWVVDAFSHVCAGATAPAAPSSSPGAFGAPSLGVSFAPTRTGAYASHVRSIAGSSGAEAAPMTKHELLAMSLSRQHAAKLSPASPPPQAPLQAPPHVGTQEAMSPVLRAAGLLPDRAPTEDAPPSVVHMVELAAAQRELEGEVRHSWSLFSLCVVHLALANREEERGLGDDGAPRAGPMTPLSASSVGTGGVALQLRAVRPRDVALAAEPGGAGLVDRYVRRVPIPVHAPGRAGGVEQELASFVDAECWAAMQQQWAALYGRQDQRIVLASRAWQHFVRINAPHTVASTGARRGRANAAEHIASLLDVVHSTVGGIQQHRTQLEAQLQPAGSGATAAAQAARAQRSRHVDYLRLDPADGEAEDAALLLPLPDIVLPRLQPLRASMLVHGPDHATLVGYACTLSVVKAVEELGGDAASTGGWASLLALITKACVETCAQPLSPAERVCPVGELHVISAIYLRVVLGEAPAAAGGAESHPDIGQASSSTLAPASASLAQSGAPVVRIDNVPSTFATAVVAAFATKIATCATPAASSNGPATAPGPTPTSQRIGLLLLHVMHTWLTADPKAEDGTGLGVIVRQALRDYGASAFLTTYMATDVLACFGSALEHTMLSSAHGGVPLSSSGVTSLRKLWAYAAAELGAVFV